MKPPHLPRPSFQRKAESRISRRTGIPAFAGMTTKCVGRLFGSPVARTTTSALLLAFCLTACGPSTLSSPVPKAAPPQPREVERTPVPGAPSVDVSLLSGIDGVVEREIAARHIPGAVVLVGHDGKTAYRKAFGHRALEPRAEPMLVDTIFDMASLTKVVATTTAVLQLSERGRLRLDDPVARYWPEFAANGKGTVTLRQLLTHSSGLRVDVNPKVSWTGYDGALAVIASDPPLATPGKEFRYSDVNFIVLGEIVRRVSGDPLDVYCSREIFAPLGMATTGFRPPKSQRTVIAPSDMEQGGLRWGEVQDPTAYRMGGVAGNAGLFSTADDLARFAQMLLNGGLSGNRRVLASDSVAAMTRPASLPGTGAPTLRGLGWDMRSPYSKEHTASFPAGSFGHTGYTGPSLWIDPRSRTFLIICANRLHPDGKGQVKSLRAAVASIVAGAFKLGPPAAPFSAAQSAPEPMDVGHGQSDSTQTVRPGIEVLASTGFALLRGRSVGLITNQTGIDAVGRSTVQLLLNAPGVRLKAIFSPEHGLFGNVDAKVASGKDPASGLTVHSLYGDVRRPTPEMLQGLDALVYDIQDVGARFYTYITTMAYAMEAAAAAGLEFFVLDRPDPITAAMVQGPVMDLARRSFTGYFPLPTRYGMTPGELAQLFNKENNINAKLHVVKLEGYRRDFWLDETGLPWVNPSPNIRSLTQAALYPGVALLESANVSVGRGTNTPFEVLGAPWASGEELARYLMARSIAGVAFEPVAFTPTSDRYKDKPCGGVRIRLTDRSTLDSPLLGVELAATLFRLYPKHFEVDKTLGMFGSRAVLQSIKAGVDPKEIRRAWQADLEAFRHLRERYLLY